MKKLATASAVHTFKLQHSMSRAGDPYDNAWAESIPRNRIWVDQPIERR